MKIEQKQFIFEIINPVEEFSKKDNVFSLSNQLFFNEKKNRIENGSRGNCVCVCVFF